MRIVDGVDFDCGSISGLFGVAGGERVFLEELEIEGVCLDVRRGLVVEDEVAWLAGADIVEKAFVGCVGECG